jgi:hypothetical protein
MLFSAAGKRIGDMAADTVVIQERIAPQPPLSSPNQVVVVEPETAWGDSGSRGDTTVAVSWPWVGWGLVASVPMLMGVSSTDGTLGCSRVHPTGKDFQIIYLPGKLGP